MTDLFSPFDLAGLTLPNKIVMAPMTRARARDDIAIPCLGIVDLFVMTSPGRGMVSVSKRKARPTGCADELEDARHVVRRRRDAASKC